MCIDVYQHDGVEIMKPKVVEPDYPEGVVPTIKNTSFSQWYALANEALTIKGLCRFSDYEAQVFYDCGYTPKGAATEMARRSGC